MRFMEAMHCRFFGSRNFLFLALSQRSDIYDHAPVSVVRFPFCEQHSGVLKHLTSDDNRDNKSAKLTQNTHIVFVVNSMVMTTFLGAGYLTWKADTANSVFFDNSRTIIQEYLGIWQELGRDTMPTNIFTKFNKDRMKTLT